MTDITPPLCRAVKHGRIDLVCTLTEDHEGWHESDCVDEEKRQIRYEGACHTFETMTREHVEWEPVDNAAEATRMLLKDRRRNLG